MDVYRVSFISLFLILSFLGTALPAQAASFTPAQTQAILSLLQAFGVDAATISHVRVALGGQPAITVSTSNTTTKNSQNTSSGSTAAMTALLLSPTPVTAVSKSAPYHAVNTNPNLVNADRFIAEIHALGEKQGRTAAELQLIETAIRAELATTTDLRQEFFNQLNAKTQANASKNSPFALFLRQTILKGLSFLGFPSVAQAATGSPFGGAIYSAIACTCSSGVWLLGIEPLPPTYAALLAYQSGSQKYSSYNLPFSSELLGFYTPGVQACYMYVGVSCSPAPNEGLIQPMVGSSAT